MRQLANEAACKRGSGSGSGTGDMMKPSRRYDIARPARKGFNPWFDGLRACIFALFASAPPTPRADARPHQSVLIRLGIMCALATLASAGARAEPQSGADMQTPFAALYSTLTAERDVAVTNGLAYGPLPRQRLDVYRPQTAPEQSPIVIFYYGGSWNSGDRAIYAFVGAALAARGITTVIPDYRLYPQVRFPTFVEDAARAYAYVARTLASGCGRQRPVFIAGHSAGAHIAALLALDRRWLAQAGAAQRPAGFIGLAGPYAFDPTTWPTTAEIFAPAARHPDATRPVTLARRDAPPALLIHGKGDDVVTPEASRALFEALKARGGRAEKVEYDGVGHVGLVLTISRPFRWRADTLDTMLDFVARYSGAAAAVPCAARRG